MSKRQRQYLNAMGIQIWESRRPSANAQSVEILDTQSDTLEAQNETSEAQNETSEAQSETPQTQIKSSPPAISSTDDIPPEYADWAAMSIGDGFADLDVPEITAFDNRDDRIAAMDWDDLQNEVSTCTACELHSRRTQAVFGVGKRNADWMIIGEAPGADEDRLGEPFVGRSGKLLDQMLLALKLDRTQVFIANIVKCRPPQNRDPQPEEARSCRPFLERQIALIQPKIILAVGRVAAQNLLQTQTAVSKLRSRVHRFGAAGIPVVVSYHPAYLLRSPREKRKAWDDLQLARRTLLAHAQSRL